jgi:hypothetical protein
MRDLLTWATHTAKYPCARHSAKTFYGAMPLSCARWNRLTRTGGVRLILGHDLDAMQLERADDSLREHEFHAAMLLPAS